MTHLNFTKDQWILALSHYQPLAVNKKWQFLAFIDQAETTRVDQLIGQWNHHLPHHRIQAEFFTSFNFQNIYDDLDQWGIQWVDFNSAAYPPLLRHIYEPPLGLFVKGQVDLLHQRALAVVGSRQANDYGARVIQDFMPALVQEPLVIVSGLARGIDTRAHQACLAAGGRTVGVIGTGIDLVYPKENRPLQVELAKHHCLVSEYPLASPPLPGHFPMRNRIIAGLAMGTWVVQAKYKSGSLITANLALNEGRDVFAVPANIFSDLAAGTNDLIKHGAKCVISAQDILDDLQA